MRVLILVVTQRVILLLLIVARVVSCAYVVQLDDSGQRIRAVGIDPETKLMVTYDCERKLYRVSCANSAVWQARRDGDRLRGAGISTS